MIFAATATASPHLLAQAPQSNSAREQDLEGVLEVIVEDAPNGAIVHHFLKTGSERIQLNGRPDAGELQSLTTDTRIKVHGRRVDANNLELGGGGGSVTTMALAAPNTFGEQRVAVILVNFQDNASQPYAWSDAANVTFGQVSDFYRENSYGQTWLTGDVFGWYTIAMSSSVCDVNTLASLAEQAATRAGVNLSNYPRRVFGFPSNACTWWGTSNIGGNPSRSWIKGTYSLKVVGHELGHAFGDFHSHSMPCDASGCSTVEYGDDRDIMGQYATGHFHAYQKERFGWVNYGNSPAIQTVSASGNYYISAYEGGGSPSAIKILKSSDQTYYYVEARTATGFDASYAGVDVHTGNLSDGNTAFEVDLDPVTSMFYSVLDPGQTFTDSAAGLTITTISADAAGAWVQITYAGQPCSMAAPTVTFSPGSSLTSPMTTTAYTMTVKDNDGAGCANAAFDVAMNLPNGWVWSSSQPTLSAAAGSSASTTIYLTPPSATGSFNVTAQAVREGSGPSGSTTATVTVASSLDISLRLVGGSQYQATATVTAGGSAMSGLTVTFVITDPKGATSTVTAVTNSIGAATIKGRLRGKDARGTYSVTASASSGGLSGTAAGTFVY